MFWTVGSVVNPGNTVCSFATVAPPRYTSAPEDVSEKPDEAKAEARTYGWSGQGRKDCGHVRMRPATTSAFRSANAWRMAPA